jgi:amide synthase
MFSVESYLSSIGYTGSTEPTPDTLRELQRRHLISIPFDNSATAGEGTAVLNDVDVDLDATFERVVVQRGGGVCFELNGLFRKLLLELGFQVDYMSAGVRGPGGTFGPDLEHMFLGTRLDGRLWLTDVGFAGPGFVDPVLVSEEVQEQYGCQYRVLSQDGYHVVERKAQGSDWAAVYRFKDQPRSLSEWDGSGGNPDSEDDAWNWEGELIAAGTIIQARSFDNGQMVLVGKRYVRVDGGHEAVKVLINPDDYKKISAHILGKDG